MDFPIRLKGNSKRTSGDSLCQLHTCIHTHFIVTSPKGLFSYMGYIAEEVNVILKKSRLIPTCSTFLLFTFGYQYN